jgi:hypothetical protein
MLVTNTGFAKVTDEGDSPTTPALLTAEISRLVDDVISVNLPSTGLFFLQPFPLCKNGLVGRADDEVLGLNICGSMSAVHVGICET